MAARTAWVLNFDAEYELETPTAYTPSASMLARMESLQHQVHALVGPSDLILSAQAASTRTSAQGYRGNAWCPTPRALAILKSTGALLPEAPSLTVLRQVNSRRFCAQLGQTLPGAVYLDCSQDIYQAVMNPSTTGLWLLKRPYGVSGRGRRRVASGLLTQADHFWIKASLRKGGGLQVEPWVDRCDDFSLHGYLLSNGSVQWGVPTVQDCTQEGIWIRSRYATETELHSHEREALLQTAEGVRAALHQAGYFGPFGIDAFRWRDAKGNSFFNPRSEINARYSMGWPVGMGLLSAPPLNE